jgi:hypothetical protein
MNKEDSSPYYVVEFDDGIQLIPCTWFTIAKTKAYWPNFIDISKYDKAVKNMYPVGKNWTLYDVKRILGSARK